MAKQKRSPFSLTYKLFLFDDLRDFFLYQSCWPQYTFAMTRVEQILTDSWIYCWCIFILIDIP